jgi:hypothetical protein
MVMSGTAASACGWAHSPARRKYIPPVGAYRDDAGVML